MLDPGFVMFERLALNKLHLSQVMSELVSISFTDVVFADKSNLCTMKNSFLQI